MNVHSKTITDDSVIAVVGLGYVGLPVALTFGINRKVIGFDLDQNRVNELRLRQDKTHSVSDRNFLDAKGTEFTSDIFDLATAKIFIVCVPTPLNENRTPDLSALTNASEAIGRLLKPNDVVIYESTVFPGATEEICVPILEEVSGLRYLSDNSVDRQSYHDREGFYCGYSPERINPGDGTHNLRSVKKVTSGSTGSIAIEIDDLYKEIVNAGTHLAPSIKVAEAAKVIENTQRDLNIGLINELAIICSKLSLDTTAVIEAASSKWNFMPFAPGLVGGHCIGVDPYYLTHKAQLVGHYPELVLAARRLNDGMYKFVVDQLVKGMLRRSIDINRAEALILGLSFKENCPDLRNSQIPLIADELTKFGIVVNVYDPWINPTELEDIEVVQKFVFLEDLNGRSFDAVILAVAHNEFRSLDSVEFRRLGKRKTFFYDLKGVMPEGIADLRL
jgi:UDP-N-acetyl-D-galactosamine dehydrogenase